MIVIKLIILTIFIILVAFGCAERTEVSLKESLENEPIKYIGDRQPDKRFYDGALPHAMGVHHYQAFRANRTHPAEGGSSGWTYNHQPFLAYWNETFYLQYLSDRFQEHTPPGRTLLMTSKNGRDWTDPVIIFPEYELPEIKFKEFLIKKGTKAVMHQRMGFYVAPNGKLLTSAFYSFCATPRHSPNAGNGLGRVVREIRKNGTFGPIYFIRYNRHAGFDESNTTFPFYKSSQDKEFIVACEELLADKLVSLQWWEEDRADDGFYVINPGDVKNAEYFSATITTSAGAGKAFNFFHKDDGSVVGIWKNQYSAISYDEGNSWSKISQNKSLLTCGAKTWGQKTEDGRYAIVHNQSPTRRNRYPMVVMTGADGHLFDDMLCLRGEVPPKRYQGLHKNTGPQYYRGIIEGNGNPPGEEMWISYSVNKEDIWVARVNTPISGSTTDPVNQDFESINSVGDLILWNVYIPKWAEINIQKENKTDNNYLELREQEPYDYVMIERVFPKGDSIEVRFRVNPKIVKQGYSLQIEVQDQQGIRPMRLRLDRSWLGVDRKKVTRPPVPIQTGEWYNVTLRLNVDTQQYDLSVDGKEAISEIPFAEKVSSLERIVFRTGPFRGYVPPEHVDDAMPKPAGLESEDLPGSDEKAPLCVYWIDDVMIRTVK